jgi:hypothetical protein
MSGTNEFKAFATAPGANVLTPAAYAALPAVPTGFVDGIAVTEQLNTVWRQSSFIAAAIAQIVADGGLDALDNGDVAGFTNKFLTALEAQLTTFVPLGQLAAPTGSSLVGFTQSGTGAVTRTLQDKGRESVSVKDFGAVGDGVTDDTAAVQNAIAAAQAVSGAVKFPYGTYKITSSLTVGNQVDIIGERGAVLKRYADIQIMNITGTYVRVSSLDFDGNKATFPSPTYTGVAIIFVTGSFNVIEDCDIYNGNAQGIALDGQSTTCQFNMVHDNYIWGCSGVGVSQSKSTDNVIANNTIRNNGYEGITVDNASYRTVVNGNRLDGNCNAGGVASIGMDSASLNSITGNVITATGSSLPGIKTQNNIAGSSYNIITGNTLIDGGAYGIHLYANGTYTSNHNVITGNVIRGFSTSAVQLDSGCNNNTVTGNHSDKLVVDNGFNNLKQTGSVAFRAYNNTLRSNVTGDGTLYTVPFDAENFDTGSNFDTTTGIFTAPTDGFYQLNATVRLEGGTNQTYAFIQIVTTNNTLQQEIDVTSGVFTSTVAGLVYMAIGNTAVVKVQCGGGTGGKIMNIVASPSLHQFSGFLVA